MPRQCSIRCCRRRSTINVNGRGFCSHRHFAKFFGFEMAMAGNLFSVSNQISAGMCDVCGNPINRTAENIGYLDSDGGDYMRQSRGRYFVEHTSRVLCHDCAITIAGTMTQSNIMSRRYRLLTEIANRPITARKTRQKKTYTDEEWKILLM